MKKFISGLIIGAVVSTTITAVASGVWDKIDVLKNDINIIVNGENITADNFVYNDTTYLPLRAVSEALNQPVDYDETTNTAYIGTKPVTISNLPKGTIPNPLYVQKEIDGTFYNITNDEFQFILSYANEEVNIQNCIYADTIADKANEITKSNRYCFLTDEFGICEYIDFKQSNTFLKCKSIISLEEYYSTVLPLLKALQQ